MAGFFLPSPNYKVYIYRRILGMYPVARRNDQPDTHPIYSFRAHSSVGEHFLDAEGVASSILAAPTIKKSWWSSL